MDAVRDRVFHVVQLHKLRIFYKKMNTKRVTIFPILSVMFFDQTCLSIIFPIMTFIFFDKQSRLFSEDTSVAVRSLWYGICISLPHIVNVFVTPWLSALSDVLGRKKIILLATLGALLVALIGAISIASGLLSLFVVACLIQGIFSRTDPIAIAAMGDISPREKKIVFMGYLQTAISIGAFFGPMIGGYFATRYFFSMLNFSFPFLVAALFALIAFFVACFFLKETLPKKIEKAERKFEFAKIKKVFANPIVLHVTIILLLSQFSWRLYYQYIPPILKTELGFNAHQLGLFVGMIAFWLSIATTFGIRFLEKWLSLEKILLFSLHSVLFGLLLTILFCALHLSGILIWLTVIPIAMGDVVAFSCITTLYSNAVEKAEQGKVMGVCFIVVALIWALTGFLGGMLMSVHPLLPILVAPIGVLIAVLLLHVGMTRTVELQPENI